MDDIDTTADHHEVANAKREHQPEQAAHSKQQHLRIRRVETRVSPREHASICSLASAQGYSSVAQYVRQQALYGSGVSPSTQYKALIACQAELNDMTGHVNQIARHLTDGEPLDEEMLMVLLQVLDLAEENLKRITQESDKPSEAM